MDARSAFLVRILPVLFFSLLVGFAATDLHAKGMNAEGVALTYVEALANGQVAEWAKLDLGCLVRAKGLSRAKGRQDTGLQQACWDDTMKSHRDMARQEAESGVFGASSLEGNFGLLHERHQAAATWREYPPAMFVSPSVIRAQAGPIPRIRVVASTVVQPVSLARLSREALLTVSGIGVDVAVSYQDPFTAPLALRPEEPWWAKGTTRKFGPIREVTARFIVVSGLRKLGFPVDMAVLNEALSDAPGIPFAHYGTNPDPGRPWVRPGSDRERPPLVGGLVLGSAQWWTSEDLGDQLRRTLDTVRTLPRGLARAHLVSRLSALAPQNAEVNAVIGDMNYDDFLAQGIVKSGFRADRADMRARSLELFWTLQAQTWRQELTAVSNEYEPAAAALYGAIGAYEILLQKGTAGTEQRRRLGALYRWNNDSESALHTHEQLLKELGPATPEYGRVLNEIAWDKIQWVSWNRRYGHPWLSQARQQAQEAEERAQGAADKLPAAYAHLVAEALHVPLNGAAVEQQLQIVKSWHDQAGKTEGLWDFLVGNDLVKSLLAEGAAVSLPAPSRSDEVVDVRVHAQPPKQDLFRVWNFDKDAPGKRPEEFTPQATGSNPVGEWQVAGDDSAPSLPNVLVPAGTCGSNPCFHFLTTQLQNFSYPDVAAQVMFSGETADQGAGLVLGAQGPSAVYFIVLNPVEAIVKFYRLKDELVTLLSSERVRLWSKPWHSLRAQRVNFLHVNRPRLAVYVDGFQVAATPEDVMTAIDRFGLVVQGDTKAKFDSLHVLDLVTNRPLSEPAAY
ncbi:MAG: hypothetical protein HP493_13715 [Nitrospira sp.]|nr:hypothetical protein [Nitrospira sp.]